MKFTSALFVAGTSASVIGGSAPAYGGGWGESSSTVAPSVSAPAYGGGWGESSSTTVPVPSVSAPVYSSKPVVPVPSVPAPAAPAHNATESWVTEVVTALTTYCPLATEIVHGSKTYTVTSATTLTITDCPCTITKSAASTAAPVVPSTPVAPVVTGSAPKGYSAPPPAGPYTYGNATSVAPVVASTGSATKSSGPAQVTANAASNNLAGAGAALAGVAGVLAYFL